MTAAPRTPLIDREAPWGEIRRALAGAQKSNRNAQAYSRWINRPFGRVLAATAYKWGLTPNAVTALSACVTFTGIALLAVLAPSIAGGLAIAACLVVGYALDSADGQVARLRGGGSPAGEWLDHIIDAFKVVSIHLAVVILWVRHLDGWSMSTALIPMAFAVEASVFFFGVIVTDLLMRMAGAKKTDIRSTDEAAPLLPSLAGIPADYGTLCLSMVLLGWFPVWRAVYIVLAVLNVGALLLQLVRWYRRFAALAR